MLKRPIACLVLLMLGVVALPRAASADEFAEHLDRAAYRLQNDEITLALTEYRAAYELRQQPVLLLAMARCERRLGHARESAELYRRFLASGEPLDAATRAEVTTAIGELGQLVAPAVPVAPPGYVLQPAVSVRMVKKSRNGLMAGGATLFSIGYVAAAFAAGPLIASEGDSNGSLRTGAGLLFIPFIGPLITGAGFRALEWAMPWAFVVAPMQIGGLAMMIVGRHFKKEVPMFSEKLTVSPYATAGGGGLSFVGKF